MTRQLRRDEPRIPGAARPDLTVEASVAPDLPPLPPRPGIPPRRSSPPPWGLLALGAVVAVAAAGVVLLAVVDLRGTSSPAVPSGAPTSTAIGPAAAGTTPVGTDPSLVAAQVDGLITRSLASRSAVVGAVSDGTRCRNLPAAAETLTAAAAERDALLAGLADLRTAPVPGSAAWLPPLQTAWRQSAAADRAYAAWVDGRTHGSCTPGAAAGPAYATAQRADQAATAAKGAFAAAWGPVAAQYRLAPRSAAAL
ncbi:MAG TPA: hypothetical protein VGD03_09415 [Frankiaceae bacterium]